MSKIKVKGFNGEYKVTENLGYSHDRRCYVKAVMIDDEERIVIAPSSKGPWEINKPIIAPFPKVRGQ